jgi:hypothetical protein
MAKVGGWLAGILAVVIGGWAVWFLTRPPAVTTFEGMVYAGSAPVGRAMVAVSLTGKAGANGPIHDITDENGAWRIDFTGLPTNAGATVSASAAGYQQAIPRVLTGPLQSDIHMDFPLNPVAASPGVGGPGPAHSRPPGLGQMPHYVPKPAAKATKFRVPAQ